MIMHISITLYVISIRSNHNSIATWNMYHPRIYSKNVFYRTKCTCLVRTFLPLKIHWCSPLIYCAYYLF